MRERYVLLLLQNNRLIRNKKTCPFDRLRNCVKLPTEMMKPILILEIIQIFCTVGTKRFVLGIPGSV